MKKFMALALLAIGLGTTVYGFQSTTDSNEKCNCAQTEVCECTTACECSSCEK